MAVINRKIQFIENGVQVGVLAEKLLITLFQLLKHIIIEETYRQEGKVNRVAVVLPV
jgi:hypothetical protein